MADQYPSSNRPSQKYFDMVQPGRTAPSPASRPFVNNGRPQADPMMSAPRPVAPMAPAVPVAAAPAPAPAMAAPTQAVPMQPNPPLAIEPPPAEPLLPATTRTSRHRFGMMIPLIIGIVVLFVIADLLVDANVIHTSVTPLTNFFHNH